MATKQVRAAIVGASSLQGKELAEELNELDLALFDAGGTEGQLTATGDEPAVIQPLEPESFVGKELVFFTGDPLAARAHWRTAVEAGAGVIDLTGGLEDQEGVGVVSPLTKEAGSTAPAIDLAAVAVVSAHPAAIMLGIVLSRLRLRYTVVRVAATVMEPASQQGSAGLDEMHGQTVALLSFQPVPQEVYDTQVAFNMNASLGSAARVDLEAIARRIRAHLRILAGSEAAESCALQLLQAPVFNGYTMSVYVELSETASAADVGRALEGGVVAIPVDDDPEPSNQSATEQGKLLLQVREDASVSGRGFWLWMAADNLRLAARNASVCGAEMLTLRPGERLQ